MARLAAERVKSGVAWSAQESAQSTEVDAEGRRDFHFTVAKFADDTVLLLFAHALPDITEDISRGQRLPAVADADRNIAHADIEKAIAQGKPTKAEELMRGHIEKYTELIATHSPHLLNQVIDWA